MTAALRAFGRRVREGESLVGSISNLASPLTAEIMATAGFDWLVFDLEHGAGGEAELLPQLQAAARCGAALLVRIEALERIRFGRVLDFGADGVLVPRLESADDARRAADYCRYLGSRGVARYNRAWLWGQREQRLEDADAQVVCAVQIETARALEAIESVAAVEGVDALVVGPVDLAHALGLEVGENEGRLEEAYAAVGKAAKGHGKAAGIIATSLEQAERCRALGFTMIAFGSDSSLLASEARRVAALLRGSGRLMDPVEARAQ